LGTLYNIGYRAPNANPEANEFGNAVAKYSAHIKNLLK
jgi:hypothetical protein